MIYWRKGIKWDHEWSMKGLSLRNEFWQLMKFSDLFLQKQLVKSIIAIICDTGDI